MAKKAQFNLYIDTDKQNLARELAGELGYDGPSELVEKQLFAFLHGDLGSVQTALEYALFRADKGVNVIKLQAIKVLVDRFLAT